MSDSTNLSSAQTLAARQVNFLSFILRTYFDRQSPDLSAIAHDYSFIAALLSSVYDSSVEVSSYLHGLPDDP